MLEQGFPNCELEHPWPEIVQSLLYCTRVDTHAFKNVTLSNHSVV